MQFDEQAAVPILRVGYRRRALGTLAALILTTLAVVSGIVNHARTQDLPSIPLSGLIAPARLSELRFAALISQGKVSAKMAADARSAGRAEPLSDVPFLLAAAADFADQRSIGRPRDAKLLSETLRRDPRSRQARMLKLRTALGTEKLTEAIEQIAQLNVLGEPGAVVLLEGVGRMLGSRDRVDEAVRALAPYPQLYSGLLRGYVATPQTPALTVHLADRLPLRALNQSAVRSLVLGRLIDDGSFTAARKLDGRANGQTRASNIHNPAFSKQAPQLPFDWELTESEVGVAERQPVGGMYVEHYGRTSGTLLQQLLTLPAGRYTARLTYEQVSLPIGAIELRVVCAHDGATLARQKLSAAIQPEIILALPFTVPNTQCEGQHLALYALPQEQRTGQQLVVKRLDVVPGNSK